MATTGRLRFTNLGSSTFTNGSNLINGNAGTAEGTVGEIVLLNVLEDHGMPAGATIVGIKVHTASQNVEQTGDISLQVNITIDSVTKSTLKTIASSDTTVIGGETDLLNYSAANLTLSNIEAMTMLIAHAGGADTVRTSGNDSAGSEVPSVEFFYTTGPDFTRRELRTPQTHSANFTSAKSFSLVNNLSTTAYFNIEGVKGYDVFNSASCTSLVNCTAVTESMHGAFIINPNATATFTLTPGSGNTIVKENVRFIASNALVFSNDDPTASGSAFGVNLDIT